MQAERSANGGISMGLMSPSAAAQQQQGGSTSDGTQVVAEELKVAQTYLQDRRGIKFSRQKLQVTAACLLPLRKLLVVGTEDGLVRVVS
jgi:hypothetical protein